MDRLSPEPPRREPDAAPHPTFEETYPRYEFAELVRLTVALAAWLAKGRRRLALRRRSRGSRDQLPGGTHPAE